MSAARAAPCSRLETAVAAQKKPLPIIISTQAPTDSDLLSVLIDDALAGHDPRVTLSLFTAPREFDPFDEATIRLANPAFDTFLNRTEVLAMAADARRVPSCQAAYENLVLNRRIEASNPFVSPSLWESFHGQVAGLAELPVLYAGLDLCAVNDLSAFVLIGQKADKWHTHCRFWLPQDGLVEKAATDHALYDAWARQGHLLTTPGRTIDYDFVAQATSGSFCGSRM